MPKILLEHQLASNAAAPHRRRLSFHSYFGLSPQKRQRFFAAGALALCCLFLLALGRTGATHARDDDGYSSSRASASSARVVPVRAQSNRLFGGIWPTEEPLGEYDAGGEDDGADGTDKELDGDALEAELGLLPSDALYDDSPPAVPPNMEPAARKRQLKALTYFLAVGDGVLPLSRSTLDPDKEITLKYLEAVGSGFVAPEQDEAWIEQVEQAYPLIVFSKSYCPYSKKAKLYLKNVGALTMPLVIEVDLRPDADTIKYLLGRLTDRSTFPNVILAFEPLGGGDDIELLHAEGGLARKLQAGGVRFPRARGGLNRPYP